MQKSILKYGSISGIIAGVLLFATTVLMKGHSGNMDMASSMALGYASMLISMSLIYFGVRHYRDQHLGGSISFGKALLVGLGIMLISCVCYSLAWLFIYYNILPTYIDDYAAQMLKKATEAGASAAEIANTQSEIASMRKLYSTPLGVFGITLLEPTPVGLLLSLVFAAILKKK